MVLLRDQLLALGEETSGGCLLYWVPVIAGYRGIDGKIVGSLTLPRLGSVGGPRSSSLVALYGREARLGFYSISEGCQWILKSST